jgi:hypothetical protein
MTIPIVGLLRFESGFPHGTDWLSALSVFLIVSTQASYARTVKIPQSEIFSGVHQGCSKLIGICFLTLARSSRVILSCFQDGIKARRMAGGWQGACEAHIRGDL